MKDLLKLFLGKRVSILVSTKDPTQNSLTDSGIMARYNENWVLLDKRNVESPKYDLVLINRKHIVNIFRYSKQKKISIYNYFKILPKK